MTIEDQNTAPVSEAPDTTQVETKPVERSDIELKALEMGWRPKEEFDGSEDDFIDAKEFVRRKPLFEKIEHQSKELKQIKQALEAFKGHYGKVQETEYQRALKDLKASLKQANREGDFDRADYLEAKVEQVEAEREALRTERESIQVETPQVDPRFVAWTDRNPWYTSQKHMRAYADEVGIKLIQQGVSQNEVLKLVEDAVKKEFPNKFQNPNKANAPAVEGRSSPRTNTKSDDFELSDLERQTMNRFIQVGATTKEKYIADLKKIKGIK